MFSSFSGQTALMIHQADHHREALTAQIRRIGLNVRTTTPAQILLPEQADVDVIFFDADTGHDSLFFWGREFPPVPLIAVLASEAPGRIEWALSQFASSFLVKPIGSGGVFQTLLVARHMHSEMLRLRQSVANLSERVRARPLVVRATLEIMRQHNLDEASALDRLRRAAMAGRCSVESLSAAITSQPALASRLDNEAPGLSLAGRGNRRAVR